jgi:hypothetical protein
MIVRRCWPLFLAVGSPLTAQDAPPAFEAARVSPATAGQWRYVATSGGSEARFGTGFVLACNRVSRTVALKRGNGAIPKRAMTIVTDLNLRRLPVNGVVAISDPVLDAIAFTRGRFIVVEEGALPLVIPASAEAARSIEDCRI